MAEEMSAWTRHVNKLVDGGPFYFWATAAAAGGIPVLVWLVLR